MDITQHELLLLPALVLVFSWNNSSITTGSLAGCELLSYKRAVLLSIAGLVTGTVLEGNKMSSVITRLSPQTSQSSIALAVIIAIALVLYLSLGNIPASITNTVIGGFVGATLASGSKVEVSYLTLIVFSWAVAPLAAALLTILIYRLATRLVKNASLLTVDVMNRVGVIVTVFGLAYSLGANNIGLINGLAVNSNSTLLTLNLMMLCLGVFLFGRRIAESVGTKLIGLSPLSVLTGMLCAALVLWVFTQFSIPVAITQVALGALIGSSLTRRPVIVNRKSLLDVFGSWAVVTLFSLALGYILTAALM